MMKIISWLSTDEQWFNITYTAYTTAVAYRGEGVFNSPPPEIPKAPQNRAKLNPIVKTVKNCWI